jgi:hypothetical protein
MRWFLTVYKFGKWKSFLTPTLEVRDFFCWIEKKGWWVLGSKSGFFFVWFGLCNFVALVE